MTENKKIDFLNNPLFTTEEVHMERPIKNYSNENPLVNPNEYSTRI